MFQHLLESKAIATPRVGGSIVSAFAHAAIVGVLVALTAQRQSAPPDDRETNVVYQPPAETVLHVARPNPSTAPSDGSTQRETVSSPSPAFFTIAPLTLVDIPDGLADVDLTRAVTGDDAIIARGQRSTGDALGRTPAGAGVLDGQPWLEHQVDAPVVMAAGQPSPAYPDMLRAAGVDGEVMVEFVVDTSGQVERGTVRIVSASHEPFAASVRSHMTRIRFIPAKAQGRTVRQLVRLPFRFAVR